MLGAPTKILGTPSNIRLSIVMMMMCPYMFLFFSFFLTYSLLWLRTRKNTSVARCTQHFCWCTHHLKWKARNTPGLFFFIKKMRDSPSLLPAFRLLLPQPVLFFFILTSAVFVFFMLTSPAFPFVTIVAIKRRLSGRFFFFFIWLKKKKNLSRQWWQIETPVR